MDHIKEPFLPKRRGVLRWMDKDSLFCKSLIFVLVAALLILGACSVMDYGQNWDEDEEITIYIGNLKEYARLFFGTNNDFNREFSEIDFATDNVNVDHGSSVYYVLAPFVKTVYANNYLGFLFLWRFATWAVFVMGVYFLYLSIKEMTGDPRYGLLGAVILVLSPRILSNGFFNHKDIAQLSLWIMMFYFTLKWLKNGGFRWAILLGVVAAFSVNMRIASAMMYFACGVTYIVQLLKKRKTLRLQHVLQGVASIAAFLAVMFLITPATWDGLFSYFFYCFKNSAAFPWGGHVFFMGTLYRGTELPLYYLPVMIAITTPIIFVALFAVGAIGLPVRFFAKKEHRKFDPALLLLVLSTAIPFAVYFISKPVLYNGWRHYYFVYGLLVVWMVLGLKFLLEYAKPLWKRILCATVALQCAVIFVLVIVTHPFQYTYYNILAGTHPEHRQEMDYWGVSGKQALEELVDTEYEGAPLKIGCQGYGSTTIFRHNYGALSEEYQSKLSVVSEVDDAEYLFVNPMYYQASEGEGYPSMDSYEECIVVEYLDSPMMKIYKKVS